MVSQVPLFVLSRLLSSLWVSRTESASDWCALPEALYKCIYIHDTIQFNTNRTVRMEASVKFVLMYTFVVLYRSYISVYTTLLWSAFQWKRVGGPRPHTFFFYSSFFLFFFFF